MEKKAASQNNKQKTPGTAGSKGRTEKDVDDLVHSPENEIPADPNEDVDDLVHRIKKSPDPDAAKMEDPDDLVHDAPDDDDDR